MLKIMIYVFFFKNSKIFVFGDSLGMMLLEYVVWWFFVNNDGLLFVMLVVGVGKEGLCVVMLCG